MFVLRSHEPEPGSGPAPDQERLRIVREAGEPGPEGADRDPRHATGREIGAAGPRQAPAGQPRGASMPMPLFAAAFAVRFGGATAAFECPRHFADVQALIDRVGASVDRARDCMDWQSIALVHGLLDDARMLLESAKRDHQRPQAPWDHARAFAKADTALGYARAAQIAQSRCTHP